MPKTNLYALILGSSSGFGRATAIELAKLGFNIYGSHLDFGANKRKADETFQEIKSYGVEVKFFNINAADETNRKLIINTIKDDFQNVENPELKIFLHSIAFGSMGPFVSENIAEQVTQKKMEMTLNIMANSLLYWTQDLVNEKIMRENGRIIALTSAGSRRVSRDYGAISVSKAALEAYIRQLGVELAPFKITANAILAGITNTPAAQKIPGFEKLLHFAAEQNPYKRNTIPEDVAQSIIMLCDEKSHWITGQTISVDGGESIFNAFK